MEKDLIVAIFAPTTGAGKMPGCVGTGYPITDDLILTARHVVEPPNRNPRAPIRVRWFYDEPADGQSPVWIPINEKDDLVWKGKGNLDAALIRCARPAHLRGFPLPRLTEREPAKNDCWESSGFARANKRDEVREPGEFGGTVRTMAQAAPYFEIIENAEPIAEEQWMGVSGMPVFVGSEILGVVKHVTRNYKGKKLKAVPIWRLLKDDSFKQWLGGDDAAERRQRASEVLRGLLTGHDEMTRDLAAGLDIASTDMPLCRAEVVEKLLDDTAQERLFQLAFSVQEKRREKRDQAGLKGVEKLLLTVLPAIYDAAVVADVRRRQSDARAIPIGLPTELKTLAEIIMAGADGRAAIFWPKPSKDYFPPGIPCLPAPPECGRDADGNVFESSFLDNLLQSFEEGDERFAKDFHDYLKTRFIQRDLRTSRAGDAEEKLRRMVAYKLNLQAEQDHLTHYFIAEINEGDPQAKAKQQALLDKLKHDFPAIAFLQLLGGAGIDVEYERYLEFVRLLDQKLEPDA